MFKKILVLKFFALTLVPLFGLAHTDAPHSSESSRPPLQNEQSVRLQKTGEIFEVVVVTNVHKTPNTIIYLSDPDSNRPIGEAEVNVEVKTSVIAAEKTEKKGVYQVDLPLITNQPLTLLIQKETFKEKIIFENLTIQHFHGHWQSWLLIPIAVVIGLGGLMWLGRYALRRRQLILIGTFLIIIMARAFAHGDAPQSNHQSKEEKNNQTNDSMTTSAGGTIIVPKDLQFQLGIVTERVAENQLQGSVRLLGSIISDPAGYVRLQIKQPSRVINHPDYPLPLPGQTVKAGQVILAVAPTLTIIESTDQKNALYKAESEITQRNLEVQRLKKLGQYAAKKDLDNAEAELQRALKQKDEITNQTFKPELLYSPIDGVVSDLHVRPGEIVTPDKTIVEVIDPSKFIVEALVFNAEVAQQITGGYIPSPLTPGKTIPLKILGVSPKVTRADQSIHIQLKPEASDPDLKLDMAVEVIGELKAQQPALIIPQKAVVEDSRGIWAFVQTNPETFEPRKIRVRRQIEDKVEIESGLAKGERLVIEGAYLLSNAK